MNNKHVNGKDEDIRSNSVLELEFSMVAEPSAIAQSAFQLTIVVWVNGCSYSNFLIVGKQPGCLLMIALGTISPIGVEH